MNEAERAETEAKVKLKKIVKCKCGLEFNSNADRAAHIRKHMQYISKEVKRTKGYKPPHSNEAGTFLRPIELAA